MLVGFVAPVLTVAVFVVVVKVMVVAVPAIEPPVNILAMVGPDVVVVAVVVVARATASSMHAAMLTPAVVLSIIVGKVTMAKFAVVSPLSSSSDVVVDAAFERCINGSSGADAGDGASSPIKASAAHATSIAVVPSLSRRSLPTATSSLLLSSSLSHVVVGATLKGCVDGDAGACTLSPPFAVVVAVETPAAHAASVVRDALSVIFFVVFFVVLLIFLVVAMMENWLVDLVV